MNNLKLGVDVVSAHNLVPKDGQGSSSAFVELHFDGQKFRSTVKEKDLDPVWNESFYFNINNPANLQNLVLEAYVYNNVPGTQSRSFLGKVRLTGTSFVSYGDAVVLHYPLEKRGIFSRVKGELGLKVYITDDPSIKSSIPLPAMESYTNSDSHSNHAQNSIPNIFTTNKAEARHTFRSVPKELHQQQQQHHHPEQNFGASMSQQQAKYAADEMKAEAPQPTIVRMMSASSSQPVDYALKETSPFLGGGQIVGGRVIRSDKPSSTYDLVEKMLFLFVRVVKARDLPSMDITGSLDPYVEVRIGNYRGKTKHFEKKQNPEWNEVFAFSRERMQASVLEVVVKDKDLLKDDFVGIVRFDIHEIPTRVPPDSPLAPEWYRLEDKKGEKSKSELMLAVWMGTQADEAFPDAWHSDAATSSVDSSPHAATLIRSKVYHAPRLWYVRVNVIEAQDLVPTEKNRFPDVYVKVQIGSQVLKTKTIQARSLNPLWNEDLLFVTAEPFEDPLILSVEDRVGANKDEIIGRVYLPLNTVDKRADDRIIHSRWFNLERPMAIDVDQLKREKFSSRINLRVCLDGGYHVLDESTHYSSDLRPTAKQLWKPSIGVLELGILSVEGLHPMKTRDGKGTSDTYCVAKYGHKWVRSRTIIDNLSPKYNEQYTWEVYDPATVLTVGVFDNSQLGGEKDDHNNLNHNHKRDMKVGKVRIRISTLETGRVYTHSYPLLVLHPSGVKKMGELHLAIRFSCTSLVNMMYIYSRPLLPKMHYARPLTVIQLDMLRHQAVNIVAARLSRAEPPLRKEVVEYMSDVDSHLWSMRRSKANFFRLMSVFSGLFAVGKWFGDVCMWKNPVTTVLVHVLFVMLVCFPELILPTVFLYMFLIGIWNFRYRPRYPPHMNTRISYAEAVHPDELDEEFDTFPTSRSPELVRMRYDRLRSVAGRIQTVVGDIATQGERMQALLSWRDPRATAIFVTFCLVAALVLYVTPFQIVASIAGFWFMRHPRFRHRLPSVPINFFRRLPARTDSML
ncbi:Multiple C2 domain and transmembrane region protein 7 [Ranunculus cassubicifolius]